MTNPYIPMTAPIAPVDLTDADGTPADGIDYTGLADAPRQPFTPNYTPLKGTRILRHRLYADEGGVASATFAGTLKADEVWVEGGTSGRLSVYAEVRANQPEDEEPVHTTLRIALVPTGKRVPEDARRIGSKRGLHAYLLGATTVPLHALGLEQTDDDGLTGADAHLDDAGE
jgi:hypothetical protein